MSRVIVVEDSAADSVNFYLKPLDAFVGGNPDLLPPSSVQVWIVGESDKSNVSWIHECQGDLKNLDVQVVTATHYERSPDALVNDLLRALSSASLVLVDRSVRGSEWPERADAGSWADKVSSRLTAASGETGPPVIVVSDHSVVTPRQSDQRLLRRAQMVWKDRSLAANNYLEDFSDALSANLAPRRSSDWSERIHERQYALIAYLRALSTQKFSQRRADLVRCARVALFELLHEGHEGPRTLSDVTAEKGYERGDVGYASPFLLRTATSHVEHAAALRRLVLYGLQKTWQLYSPFRADTSSFRVWLDVIACGDHDHHKQIAAIHSLANAVKEGDHLPFKILRTERGDVVRVDLTSVRANFVTMNGKRLDSVDIVPTDPDADGLPKADDGRIRFLEGKLSFPYPRRGRIHAYEYLLNWSGANGRPDDGAPKALWDKFWGGRRGATLGAHRVEGYSEFTQSRLIKGIGFKGFPMMYSLHEHPAPYEHEWWMSIEEEVRAFVAAHPTIWDPVTQSNTRACRWRPVGRTRREAVAREKAVTRAAIVEPESRADPQSKKAGRDGRQKARGPRRRSRRPRSRRE